MKLVNALFKHSFFSCNKNATNIKNVYTSKCNVFQSRERASLPLINVMYDSDKNKLAFKLTRPIVFSERFAASG